MFGVNNLENNPNETTHEYAREDSEANNEVFFNNPESTVKKRKMDKGRAKCPRLSSFNMSSLRLSSSNSETSKVGNEGSFFTTDEELEELRCSPMMMKNDSPVFFRKKLSSYNLTPHKRLNKKSKSHESCSSDIDGVNDPLILSDSINDSIMSPKELLGSVNIFTQEEDQMKTEQVGTPHGLICPPANCPQRPSKVRRSDATYVCNNGGERSCRLLFTKSEDAMKDAVTSYGCEAESGFSQTSEKPPITPSEFGTELNKGALSFASSVQASGSKLLDPETPAEINEDINREYLGIEKLAIQHEMKDKLLNETLKPNIQAFDFNIINTVPSANLEIKPIAPLKDVIVIPNTCAVSEIEPIIPVYNEKVLNIFLDLQKGSHTPSMPEKDKVLSENQNLDNVDKLDKFNSPKSISALNYEISKNYDKNVIGLSTPILRVDVDYSQSMATPTHDENPSNSNNWALIPSMAPVMSSDKYLSAFALSEVKVMLTPTDSPINTPGSSSSCSCSCTECDFSPPSGVKAKMMSQTIESNNDLDSEIQMPHVIDVVMDPMIIENNPSQIHEDIIIDPIIVENIASQIQEDVVLDPITVENKVSNIQENVVESSNKSYVKISERNDSLTSTPKDLTPYSVKSNITAISGVSPLPSSTPRPKRKHKHHHHHHHHHHRHHYYHHHDRQQQSMHHLTVHSNSHHHITADGDILITSTPLNRQNSVEELVKEEISAVGSDIDSANSEIYGKPSRFVMSDLCGSDQSVNQYSLVNNINGNTNIFDGSGNIPNWGGANYVTGKTGSGSFDVMYNKKSANNSDDNYKLHLGTDASPDGWMINESVLLPRRASSVDETLFRVFSQESPVCLSLN